MIIEAQAFDTIIVKTLKQELKIFIFPNGVISHKIQNTKEKENSPSES